MRAGRCLLAALFIFGSIQVSAGAPSDDAAPLKAIARKLDKGDIQRVEIIWIPAGILTGVRTTPEILEGSFHYKLLIRDGRGSSLFQAFQYALQGAEVQRSQDPEDLRWGIHIFDENGGPEQIIYLNRTGDGGLINNAPMKFNRTIFRWLKMNTPASLQ